MSITKQRLQQTPLAELPVTLRNAGVAGAGGAGFPSCAKWDRIEEVDHLLVNHQESEPNYYIDKWIGRERADELAALFDALLDRAFETIVVGAKKKDRDEWLRPLESATDATVRMPEDLPLNPETESGVVVAYSVDEYQYGMEQILLRKVADVVLRGDLPMDYGWLVQNTETIYNIYRALEDGSPVTRKFVHVDGQTLDHRFLEVPVGTPASAMLAAAGRSTSELAQDAVLLDGGPGWCFEIDSVPDAFGVRKRTNCVIVTDRTTVDANALGNGRVDIRDQYDWRDSVDEVEPSTTLEPEYVRIPLVSNPAFEGVVQPSDPIVERGDTVAEGEMVARPAGSVSNAQHASVGGVVTDVSDTHVEIESTASRVESATKGLVETDGLLYWTWCVECGTYVVHPEMDGGPEPTRFVCTDCRTD